MNSLLLLIGFVAGIPTGAMIHHYLMTRERREILDLTARLRKAYHELRDKLGETDAAV